MTKVNQAYSCVNALEWINHLNNLVAYWTRKHRIDSRQEMELVQIYKGRPRLFLKPNGLADPPNTMPDHDDVAQNLSDFWNWCVLDSCRSIIKSGRLFMRKGSKGVYKYEQSARCARAQQFQVSQHGACVRSSGAIQYRTNERCIPSAL